MGVGVCKGSPCTAVTPTCTCLQLLKLQVTHHSGQLSHTHPQSRPTLRAAGTLQGVPPSCCGRRVAVWSGVCSSRHQEKAARACEPGGGGCGGVPVHPAQLHAHRTSPTQALLTILTLNPTSDLLSHCCRRDCGVRCALVLRAERGWVKAVNGAAVDLGFRRRHGK